MDFCHLRVIYVTNTEKNKQTKKKTLDTATKTGLYAPKTIPKKVAH